MIWPYYDAFFLCLVGSFVAFVAPSIIDELTGTIQELFGRRRKPPPVIKPATKSVEAVDPPSPWKRVDPPSPLRYLKKARPLDGLQRDRPQAAEQFSRLCESTEAFPPKEQASRVREYFGIFGGARPAEGRNRRRFTAGEIQRLEQRARTRL